MKICPRLLRYTLILSSASLVATELAAQVFTITHRVTVQPIHITNGSGGRANNDNLYFEQVADRIFAQVGVDIEFLPAVDYENATFYNGLDLTGSSGSAIDGGGGINGGHVMTWNQATGNTTDASFLRLFFASNIGSGLLGATGTNAYEESGEGIFAQKAFDYGMGVFISDTVFSIGRIDTIAHEIGHALALAQNGHDDFTGTPFTSENLMADGGIRTIPSSIDDVYSVVSGTGTDQLTAAQVNRILEMFNGDTNSTGLTGSNFFLTALAPGDQYDYSYSAVPEPSTFALVSGISALAAGCMRRRRRLARFN